MIQQFPIFSKLDISYRDEVKIFTAKFEPYSDFDFSCLLCWNVDNSTELSYLNNNLIVKGTDYITGNPTVSCLGVNAIDSTLSELIYHFGTLKHIPEITVENIKKRSKFIIIEDRDDFDYIFDVRQVATLPGGTFKKKRNKFNNVAKAFSHRLTVKNLKRLNRDDVAVLRQVYEEWKQGSHQTAHALRPLSDAINKLLDYAPSLGLFATLILLDSKVVAFSLSETLHDGYAICHFEESLPVHEQFSTFVASQACKELLKEGCNYVNWESDMGLPGLRKSKLNYQPSFLKKYLVSKA